MKKKRTLSSHTKGTIKNIESIVEVILTAAIYFVFWTYFYKGAHFPAYGEYSKSILVSVYAFLLYIFIKNSDGFEFGQFRKADLLTAQWIAILLVNLVTYFQLSLITNQILSPLPMLFLTVAEGIFAFGYVVLIKVLYYHLYPPYNMVMIYGSKAGASMKLKMDQRRDKYQINAMLSAEKGYDHICQEILKHDAVVLNDIPAQLRNDILKFCYQHSIRVYVVPKITDILLRDAEDISAFDTPLFLVAGQGLTAGQRFAKRTMDILLSLIALILASPVMLAIAIAIKCEDKGPIFFKQTRVTLGGKTFSILKFRSMIVDAEKDGMSIPATGKDPRITKVGHIIRRCRFDELPQLINILKGDMSIVGPRPERVEHMEKYSAEIPEFNYRLKVKGGLTGYAQIYGKYNTSAYDKLRLDLMYIEHYSILMDIKLILITARVLFSKESTEGFETVEENNHKLDEMMEQIEEADETSVPAGK